MRNALTLSTLTLGLALSAATSAGFAGAPTDTLKGHYATSMTLDTNKTWILSGYVSIDSPAVLTIKPGTVVQGQKSTKGTLAIGRGAKLIAEGTKAMPITFTSDEAAGSKTRGSWGGIVILGKAKTNLTGTPAFEAVSDWAYGGTDNEDSSGSLKYVRVEVPGFPVAPDKELNGLTMCTVGSKTKISYVQVHNGDDDGFEWFSGTVNADHLIVTNQVDDGFDSDNGFAGNVSWSINMQGGEEVRKRVYIVKDSKGADSTVTLPDEVVGDKCFESSSTKVAGGAATPRTNPTWSHITGIDNGKSGGSINLNQYAVGQFDHVLLVGDSSAYAIKLESSGTNAGLIDATPLLNFKKCYTAGTWKSRFQTDDTANAVVIKATLEALLKNVSGPLNKDLSLANDTLKNDSVGAIIGGDLWYKDWSLPGTMVYAKGLESTGIKFARSAQAASELLTVRYLAGNLAIHSIASLQVSVEVVNLQGKSLFHKSGIVLAVGQNQLGTLWTKLPSGSHYLVVRSGTYSLRQKLNTGVAVSASK
jgi:hypothetical protein